MPEKTGPAGGQAGHTATMLATTNAALLTADPSRPGHSLALALVHSRTAAWLPGLLELHVDGLQPVPLRLGHRGPGRRECVGQVLLTDDGGCAAPAAWSSSQQKVQKSHR